MILFNKGQKHASVGISYQQRCCMLSADMSQAESK